MAEPAVVAGSQIEGADWMDAGLDVEHRVVGQEIPAFGTEEPVGHALNDKIVVVAPAQPDVPLAGQGLVTPPAFGGEHDVHGLKDRGFTPVGALHQRSEIAIAKAKVKSRMAGIPTQLKRAGELLQVEREEVTPEVAVFEGETLLLGSGEQGGAPCR